MPERGLLFVMFSGLIAGSFTYRTTPRSSVLEKAFWDLTLLTHFGEIPPHWRARVGGTGRETESVVTVEPHSLHFHPPGSFCSEIMVSPGISNGQILVKELVSRNIDHLRAVFEVGLGGMNLNMAWIPEYVSGFPCWGGKADRPFQVPSGIQRPSGSIWCGKWCQWGPLPVSLHRKLHVVGGAPSLRLPAYNQIAC